MGARPAKQALIDELAAGLAAALASARAAHQAAVEGATHDEARAENDKDTRGLEQSYLARGQAARVEELSAAVDDVARLAVRGFTARDPIALGALVTVEDHDGRHRYLIAPAGGGTVLAGGVQVVTPRSPLGRALAGRRRGDDTTVALPGGSRDLDIVAVE